MSTEPISDPSRSHAFVPSRAGSWIERLPDDTELGTLIREHPWESTPLGPPARWPAGLQTAVELCLNTRFPMMIAWGPELIKIYNDGYRRLLGEGKHPRALGRSPRTIWPEIWDFIGPLFASVMNTAHPTWTEHAPLDIDRNGFLEECFFTFSYSPLFDDDGSVGGVLDVAVETTSEVVTSRRMTCLAAVTAALIDVEHPTDACVAAVRALSRHAVDVPAADIRLMVDDALVPVATNRRFDLAVVDAAALGRVVETARSVVIGDDDPARPARRIAVPFLAPGGTVDGVLIASLNRRRPFDAEYRRFIEVLARTIATAVDLTQRQIEALDEHRTINETLQQAMLSTTQDSATVAARYVAAATNLSVGGDWYDVIDLPSDRRGIVVGDCVGHGLQAATIMSQLRSAAQALVLEGHDAAATVQALDRFASTVPGASCASVVCAIVDRRAQTVEYCNAGHPPPLVVGCDRDTWLDGAGGPVLGVDTGHVRTTTTARLHDEDLIVFYSDGLIARSDEPFDDQLESIARTVREVRQSTVSDIADELLRRLVGPANLDDIVIVVKRLESAVG